MKNHIALKILLGNLNRLWDPCRDSLCVHSTTDSGKEDFEFDIPKEKSM